MKLLTDPQRVLAHVVALRVEEEKPAEAVAADAAAVPAEPEVIKKGKKEAEEGEEGEEAAPVEKEKKK
jgi:large subunit ribosomal protein L25